MVEKISSLSHSAGLLKLRVATCKLVPELSNVGCENAICKIIIVVMTSVSVPTSKTMIILLALTGDMLLA